MLSMPVSSRQAGIQAGREQLSWTVENADPVPAWVVWRRDLCWGLNLVGSSIISKLSLVQTAQDLTAVLACLHVSLTQLMLPGCVFRHWFRFYDVIRHTEIKVSFDRRDKLGRGTKKLSSDFSA